MKKILSVLFSIAFAVGAFALSACNSPAAENDERENGGEQTITRIVAETGASVEGVQFDPRTTLKFEQKTQGEDFDRALAAIDDYGYEKNGLLLVYDVSLLLGGEQIQPSGKVTVTIPAAILNLSPDKSYSLYHVKSDGVEKLDIVKSGDNVSFETTGFSLFVFAEDHEHEYGDMYYARPATFFEAGNVAYYHCEKCDTYFDENMGEIESPVIEKLSTDIALLVDGEKKCDFTVDVNEENLIRWISPEIELTKDQVLSLTAKDGSAAYEFFANTSSNITIENKIHNDATAIVSIDGTPNGLFLSVSGFEYDGITVKVTRDGEATEYPMNAVEYDEKSSYVYGYLYFEKDDTFVVCDHDNKVEYGYSDVSEEDAWLSYVFTEGEQNAIKVANDYRLGIELLNGKILIDTIFAPSEKSDFALEIAGVSEKTAMTERSIEQGTEAYEDAVFTLKHPTTINNEDIVSSLDKDGYVVYHARVGLPADSQVRIYDALSEAYIENTHLSYVAGVAEIAQNVTLEGEYIKLAEAGTYDISFVLCSSLIVVYKVESEPVVTNAPSFICGNSNVGNGGILKMTVTENSGVFETGELDLGTMDLFQILFDQLTYVSVNGGEDLVKVVSGYLCVKKEGTYNVKFDATAKTISVVLVKEKEDSVLTACSIYIQSDSIPHTMIIVDGTNFEYKGAMKTNDYVFFNDQNGDRIEDATLDSSVDPNVLATLLPGAFQAKADVTASFYIDKTTHVVRVVVEE